MLGLAWLGLAWLDREGVIDGEVDGTILGYQIESLLLIRGRRQAY